MAEQAPLLQSRQMARFVARGFLQLDAIVPDEINAQFLESLGPFDPDDATDLTDLYRRIMAGSTIDMVPAGTRLADAYPPASAPGRMLGLPLVRGAIASLLGPDPAFDHHFLHITFPPGYHRATGSANVSQHTHQDSTIDPRRAFDIQIMYFPQAVTEDMGGTRFVPGSHLRRVSEAAVSRYQNVRGQVHVVCPAGTLLFLHHGLWHGAGVNQADTVRFMFKIRIAPTSRQLKRWDTGDLTDDDFRPRPIFWTGRRRNDDIQSILTRPEPWFEQDTARLEYVNRIRLWRYLLGDETFDADYWLTRLENEYD